MPADQQSNNEEQNREDYRKDINLLPEDLRRELKSTGAAAARRKFSQPRKNQSARPAKPKTPGLMAWWKSLGKQKVSSPTSQPEAKTAPVKFQPSVKPNLQVDVTGPTTPTTDEELDFLAVSPASQPSADPGLEPEPPTPAAPPPPLVEKKPAPAPDQKDQKDQKPEEKPLSRPAPGKKLVAPSAAQPPPPPAAPTKERKPFASIREIMEKDQSGPASNEDFEVNLIPTEYISTDILKRFQKQAIIVGIASLVAVGILYLAISVYGSDRQQQILEIKEKIQVNQAEIDNSKRTLDQLSDFTKQTRYVSEVLVNQKRWSNLFSFLEAETISEVYFDSVIGGKDNKVTLSVNARSYYDLARQVLLWKGNSQISQVEFNSASIDLALWEEYLTNLKNALAEQESLRQQGRLVTQEIVIPGYSEMKDLVTVKSTISFYFNPTLMNKE